MREKKSEGYVLLAVGWLVREKLGDQHDTSARIIEGISHYLLLGNPQTRWTKELAVKNGWYHWLRQFGVTREARRVLRALRPGSRGIATLAKLNPSRECIRENCYLFLYHALYNDNLIFFKWYIASYIPNWDTIRAVVDTGHLHALRWLCLKHAWIGSLVRKVIRVTPQQYRLDVLAVLSECLTRPWPSVIDDAATRGDLDVVKWLDAHRPEGCTTAAMEHAAARGDLEMVQYLHVHRSEGCTKNAMDKAAANGHLEVVRWLHENRVEGCSTAAMDFAASNGHLKVVRWLHVNREEGCTQIAMTWAASRGYYDVLEWLNEHRNEGCSAIALTEAASHGRWGMVSWLLEHQPEPSLAAMDKGVTNHEWWIRRWSQITNDLEARRVVEHAAMYGKMNVIQWLHKSRPIVFTAAVMDLAAQNNHLEVVRFLHVNRREGCTIEGLLGAIKSRRIQVVNFLYESRLELAAWPALQDAPRLLALLLSHHKDDQAVLRAITARRRIRYHLAPSSVLERAPISNGLRANSHIVFVWTSVNALGFPDALGVLISEFLASPALALRWTEVEAATRGWIHWIRIFSHLEHRHLFWAAQAGNFEAVRCFHAALTREKRLRCDRDLVEIALAQGNVKFILWHLQHCRRFSVEAHVYLAVWTGRMNVLEAIKIHWRGGRGFELDAPVLGINSSHGAEAIEEAAVHGDLQTLQNLVFFGKSVLTPRVLDLAAQHGQFKVVQWLVESCGQVGTTVTTEYLTLFPEVNPSQVSYAQMRDGFLARVESVQSQACTPMELAARQGHLDVVQFLHHRWCGSNLTHCTTNAVDFAAMYGHLNVVEFLLDNRGEGGTIAGFYGAIHNRYVEVVRCLYDQCQSCRQWPASQDGPAVLQSFIEQSDDFDKKLCELVIFFRTRRDMRLPPQVLDVAVLCGNEKRATIIHELNIGTCTTLAMDVAATKGDMGAVEFLHSKLSEGCTVSAMDGAAEEGHLDVVKFLHENRSEGCTRLAIDLAAKNGHADVVKYLLEHRSESCSPYALYWATLFGYDKVVYLLTSDKKYPGDVDKCLQVAEARGYKKIIKHLRGNLAADKRNHTHTDSSRARQARQQEMLSVKSVRLVSMVYKRLALTIDPSMDSRSLKTRIFRKSRPTFGSMDHTDSSLIGSGTPERHRGIRDARESPVLGFSFSESDDFELDRARLKRSSRSRSSRTSYSESSRRRSRFYQQEAQSSQSLTCGLTQDVTKWWQSNLQKIKSWWA